MTRNRIITLAVVLIACAATFWWMRGDDSYEIVNAQPQGEMIIAFGDSLTAGNGASDGKNYPQQLAALIGRPIINKGISGQTTAQAIKRFERDVLQQDTGILLLLLGGNDFMQKKDKDKAFARLETMISQAQDQGVLVIVIGLDFPMAASWDTRYRTLAQKTGCPIVPDVMAGVFGRRKLMADSIHPNDAGYAIIAKRIADVLRPYLR